MLHRTHLFALLYNISFSACGWSLHSPQVISFHTEMPRVFHRTRFPVYPILLVALCHTCFDLSASFLKCGGQWWTWYSADASLVLWLTVWILELRLSGFESSLHYRSAVRLWLKIPTSLSLSVSLWVIVRIVYLSNPFRWAWPGLGMARARDGNSK